MTDTEFLGWIRDRLVHVYGESPNVDFVLRLDKIVGHRHDWLSGQHAFQCACGEWEPQETRGYLSR